MRPVPNVLSFIAASSACGRRSTRCDQLLCSYLGVRGLTATFSTCLREKQRRWQWRLALVLLIGSCWFHTHACIAL
eukprot:3034367-Karenia_brevis.AAC.1